MFWPLMGPLLCNFESPCPKGHACIIWSTLAQNFQRRYRKCENFSQMTDKQRTDWAFCSAGELINYLTNEVQATSFRHFMSGPLTPSKFINWRIEVLKSDEFEVGLSYKLMSYQLFHISKNRMWGTAIWTQ